MNKLLVGLPVALFLALVNTKLKANDCYKWEGCGTTLSFGSRLGCGSESGCGWVQCSLPRYQGASGLNDNCGSPAWCDGTEPCAS